MIETILNEVKTHQEQLLSDINWDIKYYTEERDKAQRRLEKSELALEKFKEKYGETQL